MLLEKVIASIDNYLTQTQTQEAAYRAEL